MKTNWLRLVRVASVTLAATVLSTPTALLAQIFEEEPNDTCRTAQMIGFLPTLPTTVHGELTESDIDFYWFEMNPETWLRTELRGQGSDVGTLGDPYLGLFDSNCQLLDYNDDSELGLESRLEFVVPNDGIFILAATAYWDGDFDGGHGSMGSYELRVMEAPPGIGSVSGRLVNAVSGLPLAGHEPPYSYVELRQCDEYGCYNWKNSMSPDVDGRFFFDSDYDGRRLTVGEYVVSAWANEYEPAETAPFVVGEDEHHDVGDISLQPPPLQFANIRPCAVSVAGGRCQYKVDVYNNTRSPLRGIAWSNVEAWGIGSPLDYTRFTANRLQKVRVPAISHRTVRFNFNVPAGVSDGAMFCTDGWFADRSMSHYGTLRNDFLFCFEKQFGEMATMETKVAKGLLKERREKLDRSHGPKISTSDLKPPKGLAKGRKPKR